MDIDGEAKTVPESVNPNIELIKQAVQEQLALLTAGEVTTFVFISLDKNGGTKFGRSCPASDAMWMCTLAQHEFVNQVRGGNVAQPVKVDMPPTGAPH